VNVNKTLTLEIYKIMESKINNLEVVDHEELKSINGGGIGVALGIAGLILTGAAALGYYDGKKDCMPPPCE